jgi:actin-like ATPase involved in cell morphogenesis
MELDIRSAAAELFIEAASRLSDADSTDLVGANRLLPRLLAMDEDPSIKESFRALGLEISEKVRAFLEQLGEPELADDIASNGFVAAAALAFVTEEEVSRT